MNKGDLVIWTGRQTEHSMLKNRVIYQVMEVFQTKSEFLASGINYRLRPAFDFGQPMGVAINTIVWHDSDLRKITLVDLGVIRLSFDNFIREHARELGMEDHYGAEDGGSGSPVAT